MRKTTLLAALLFALIVPIGIAQDRTQTVRGTVVDTQSKSSVIGANVVIVGSDPIQGDVTGIDGSFRIPNVPVGRHNIRFTYIGYEDLVIPEVLVGSGKEVILNVTMTESLLDLGEVVVTVEKGKAINDLATVSALSFSVEETSRYAATFDDPARAALSLAGVRGGGDDVLNEIVIRGNSPRGLLWRIEGLEVPNPNHFAEDGSSAGGINLLSASVLSNSDFFTGAFPAEYGNALSGVFDIRLRNGNSEKREYALQAGLLGIALAAEGPFSKNSNASYLANYRYSTLALFDQVGIDLLGESEEITFQDLSFKFFVPSRKAGIFSIWGLGGISEQITRAFDGDFINEDYLTQLGVVGLTHTYFLDQETYVETKVNFSGSENTYNEDSLGVQVFNSERFVNTALRGSLSLNKKFNARHTVRAGAIASHLGYDLFSQFWDFRERRFRTELDQSGSSQYLRSYAQWNYRLSEDLTLNTGLHYARFLLNDNSSLEPRLGLKWEFDDTQSVSAGFGIHSRLETLSLYLGQAEQPDGSFAQLNRDLDFTKARHYVVGYENQITPAIRIKTEAYYQDLFDVPIAPAGTDFAAADVFSSLNQSDGFTTFPLENNGTGENYGIELTVEKFFTNDYYFMVTGSVFESKYKGADKVQRDTRYNGNFVSNTTAGKEFKVGKGGNNLIAINGRFIWTGNNRVVPIDLEQSRLERGQVLRFEDAFSERLPDYWRIDAGFSYRINRARRSSIIALNIQNVTARGNAGEQFYNPFAENIFTEDQLGILPNLSYRLEF